MAKEKNKKSKQGSYEPSPYKSVTENDVGITEFVCKDGKGFVGVVKHRYRDFVVNEIDLSGNVVRLTSLFKQEPVVKAEPVTESKLSKKALKDGIEALKNLLDKESSLKVRKILVESNCVEGVKPEGSDEVEGKKMISAVMPHEDDKQKRSKLHQLIREHFGSFLVTDTVNNAEETEETRKLAVRVVLYSATEALGSNRKRSGGDSRNGREKKRRKKGRNNKVQVDWRSAKSKDLHTPAKKGPQFLKFVLYKENVETHHVVNKILRSIRNPQCKILSAGTKDKRAVTVQYLTATSCSARDIHVAVKNAFRSGNVVVGNFEATKGHLHLGDLQGNRFCITLRRITSDAFDVANERKALVHLVEKRIKSLGSIGFVNYFGLQRFGSRATPTHAIGRAIMEADFEQVCKLILKQDSRDRDNAKEAKSLFLKGEIKKAADKMPFDMTAEKAILKYLAENKSDSYEDAFKQVTYSLRTLYTHAYQSYIWNTMVSARIRKHGVDSPVVGDIVLLPVKDEKRKTSKSSKPKVLTQADIDSGKWSIQDVVMPQPGYDVVYPQHSAGEKAYRKFVKKDSNAWKNLSTKRNKYSLPGGYRSIMVLPQDVSHMWIDYDGDNDELCVTDYDKLQGAKDISSKQKGSSLALQMSFNLPSSSYATMFLRELTFEAASRLHQKLE